MVADTFRFTVNPVGITTSFDAVGNEFKLQLATVFQLLLEPAPVQVFVCAEIVKQKMLKIESNNSRFIIVGYRII